jgi:Carboxylesterase family
MADSLAVESGALAVPEPDANGVRAYKGIPYATPPIGPLRWRPPEPVAPCPPAVIAGGPASKTVFETQSGATLPGRTLSTPITEATSSRISA